MSPHGFDLDLTKPTQSGVYFVGVNDLDRLARAAESLQERTRERAQANGRDQQGNVSISFKQFGVENDFVEVVADGVT